ncbi:MAG: SpoIID/LytB domain-containing protein, partial [Clostridia bacterium]|nr:SpoIID/LytB domain-containing protein [Clostridia bacterium]
MRTLIRRLVIGILGMALIACIVIYAITPTIAAPVREFSTVRVRLTYFGTPQSKNFTPMGKYAVDGQKTFLTIGREYKLSVVSGRIKLTGEGMDVDLGTHCFLRQYPVSAEPKDNALKIANNGETNYYPGNMVVTVSGGGLRFVNQLFIEDYLYGVLPHEIGENRPFDAQKAQALCARTFTAYMMLTSSQKDSDLGDTDADQVYRGLPEKIPNVRRAVDETFGQLLKYNDQPIYAAYSSSNGGWTETNQAMFGGAL